MPPLENHEKTTFCASILKSGIALTRALYDKKTVRKKTVRKKTVRKKTENPGQPSKRQFVKKTWSDG